MKLTEKERQEAQNLLVSFLNIASVNGTDGELSFAKHIYETLENAGLEVLLEPLDDKRANVIATLKGRDTTRNIVLNGHLDTVKYGELSNWHTDPTQATLVDRRVYGRGSTDMKSGLAGLVMALILLKRKGIVPAVNLVFAATCDEESGGAGATASLNKAWLKEAEFILVGEPTALKFGLAEKACNWLKLIVHGKTGHGAYPERGVNAIERGFAIIERVRTALEKHHHPLLGRTTLQITQVHAGILPNMTPDRAEFVLDIRNTPSLSNEALFELIEEESALEAAKTAGLLRTELEAINSRPPLESDAEEPWIKNFDAAYQKLVGTDAAAAGVNFYTDASLFVQANPKAAILLFGPGEPDLCHQANEYVELDMYEKFVDIVFEFLRTADGGI